jgi:hypothetical protein
MMKAVFPLKGCSVMGRAPSMISTPMISQPAHGPKEGSLSALGSGCIMTQLIKHAWPFNYEKNPQQVRAIINASAMARFIVKENLIARSWWCHVLAVGLFLLKDGACFTKGVMCLSNLRSSVAPKERSSRRAPQSAEKKWQQENGKPKMSKICPNVGTPGSE